jgi:glyoxylase-like metal-dependent hydrolase (beta-lactamase superfamily II)
VSVKKAMTGHAVPRRWRNGLIEIGPKVFAYVQAAGIDPGGDTGVSNSGLIVGPESAIAVDALMVASMTRRLLSAYKRATRKPIAKLINTHHHLDHTGGNRFFRRASIISTEACREALAPGFPPVRLLQRFMPRFAREFPAMKVALPTVTFRDRLAIHDGAREIQLWHPGRPAHTVGDATVYLPREKILFAGDIAFHYVTPLAFQGHIGNWIKVADRLLGFDADVIVPGHGPIGTKADLTRMRNYLALVRREARKRFDAGMPAAAAARDIRLGVYAAWSDAERVFPNVLRCYQEFRDELEKPMDLRKMLAGMESLRGRRPAHHCL